MTKFISAMISVLLLLIVGFAATTQAEEVSVPVSDDVEVAVEKYAADGAHLVLWFAPEYGFRKAHKLFAAELARNGIEVWQMNMAEALFMPLGSTSIKKLDGRYMADVIEYAYQQTGKKIVVAGDSYGALAALKAAHGWQRKQDKKAKFIGAILFSPYTYATIPPLGLPPAFMPEVSSTSIPLMIYQAKDSGTINQFDRLLEQLRKNGSPVYIQIVPEVMSLFHDENPTESMLRNARPLPKHIVKILRVLEKQDMPLQAVEMESPGEHASGIDTELKRFVANARPVPIVLKDINDNIVTKNNFKGRVTVVNFWATWCRPCVEEIPSLNRLSESMKDVPFELISINYAEDKQEVIDFMKMVHVAFPVLMDYNGEFAKQWNVVTYPSTFLIGPDGEIRYGVNAAIEWDTPEIKSVIREMLK